MTKIASMKVNRAEILQRLSFWRRRSQSSSGQIDDQEQSSLLSKLPPELRIKIYRYVIESCFPNSLVHIDIEHEKCQQRRAHRRRFPYKLRCRACALPRTGRSYCDSAARSRSQWYNMHQECDIYRGRFGPNLSILWICKRVYVALI
jgi:hypothetical protein